MIVHALYAWRNRRVKKIESRNSVLFVTKSRMKADPIGVSSAKSRAAAWKWSVPPAVAGGCAVARRSSIGSHWISAKDTSALTAPICFDNMVSHSERFFILIMWNDTDTPLAYFISFRSYGTWLHGDDRGSIDRFNNDYGAPYLPQSDAWERHNRKQRKGDPFILGARERQAVQKAIRETCSIRKWHLQALNVRTNHVLTVVTANRTAGSVLNAFKAN